MKGFVDILASIGSRNVAVGRSLMEAVGTPALKRKGDADDIIPSVLGWLNVHACILFQLARTVVISSFCPCVGEGASTVHLGGFFVGTA